MFFWRGGSGSYWKENEKEKAGFREEVGWMEKDQKEGQSDPKRGTRKDPERLQQRNRHERMEVILQTPFPATHRQAMEPCSQTGQEEDRTPGH